MSSRSSAAGDAAWSDDLDAELCDALASDTAGLQRPLRPDAVRPSPLPSYLWTRPDGGGPLSPTHTGGPQLSEDSREERAFYYQPGPRVTQAPERCSMSPQYPPPATWGGGDAGPPAAPNATDRAGPSTAPALPGRPRLDVGASTSTAAPPRPKRPRLRNRGSARCITQHAGAHAALERGVAPLAELPDDVITRILHGVSAADLTSCARACSRLRRLSVDESLWRRLYCFRWRFFKGGECKVPHAHFWKVTYMQRDESEFVANVLLQRDARLQEQYRSMQLTERSSPVTAVREPSWSVQTASAQEQLAGYLRSRGFQSDVPKPGDLGAVQLLRFGDVFVDERSGWTHVCDGSCTLQEADDDATRMACPLTGRVHSRIAADECCDPGGVVAGGATGGEGGVDAAAPPGLGWLAQVYEAGYRHCDGDEDDPSGPISLLPLQLPR